MLPRKKSLATAVAKWATFRATAPTPVLVVVAGVVAVAVAVQAPVDILAEAGAEVVKNAINVAKSDILLVIVTKVVEVATEGVDTGRVKAATEVVMGVEAEVQDKGRLVTLVEDMATCLAIVPKAKSATTVGCFQLH